MSDRRVVDRFVAYLRDHNLPVTAQRLAIAEVVLGSDRHLSAEEIAQTVAARGTAVGTATVYRTIDTLLASGLVVERDFGRGSDGSSRRGTSPTMSTSSVRSVGVSRSSATSGWSG